VRNNKQVPISVLLEDQVPLSQNKNSMVNIVEFGGGDLALKIIPIKLMLFIRFEIFYFSIFD